MKKDGITIMLIGLGITMFTAFFYFSKTDQHLMNNFVVTIGNSYHFNWLPLIGISVMAIGEFLLWESQNNKNLMEVKTKFITKSRMRYSNAKLELVSFSNLQFISFKVLKTMLMFLKM